MTKSLANHIGREFGGDQPDTPGVRQDEVFGELLDRVRRNAVDMIADLRHPPRTLRVRAGDVLVEVEWDEERRSVTEVERPLASTASAVEVPVPAARTLSAPMVGVFYRAAEPGAAPFVGVGDAVVAGQQIGIIEAMKLMVPIVADQAGVIAVALKADGESVEFGEPLFALDAV
ncbi:MAG: acetyl-CoA carboxylase biotin carboxyl carrier protein subunit [Actinomycetota bacterium]|nr:acetyl-CoA carboxylase biotin carboxyl carrier protein subunit [Actinomycetota bacterium]